MIDDKEQMHRRVDEVMKRDGACPEVFVLHSNVPDLARAVLPRRPDLGERPAPHVMSVEADNRRDILVGLQPLTRRERRELQRRRHRDLGPEAPLPGKP